MAALDDERKELHKAIEKAHRNIVAERARVTISKRLHGHGNVELMEKVQVKEVKF